MRTNIIKIGAALLAVGIGLWSVEVRAQTTATTVTTTRGAFTEYAPGSETMTVRTEANTAPLHYVVTKETRIVDETGAPVTIERIAPGSPLSVEYTGTGDRLVASRIVVQRPAAVTTTVPAVTERETTTTTTRDLTKDEKHALKEEREHQKKQEKKAEEEVEKDKDHD